MVAAFDERRDPVPHYRVLGTIDDGDSPRSSTCSRSRPPVTGAPASLLHFDLRASKTRRAAQLHLRPRAVRHELGAYYGHDLTFTGPRTRRQNRSGTRRFDLTRAHDEKVSSSNPFTTTLIVDLLNGTDAAVRRNHLLKFARDGRSPPPAEPLHLVAFSRWRAPPRSSVAERSESTR